MIAIIGFTLLLITDKLIFSKPDNIQIDDGLTDGTKASFIAKRIKQEIDSRREKSQYKVSKKGS